MRLLLILSAFFALQPETGLKGKRWHLQKITDLNSGKEILITGKFVLTFGDSTFQGVNCSAFFGRYYVNGDTLYSSSYEPLVDSDCNEQEAAADKYLSSNIKKIAFTVNGKTLTLENKEKVRLLYSAL